MRYNHFDMLPDQAFQRDASGKIKPQGGGGSSSPSKSTVTQTNIPEYARPYAEESLGRAQALTDVNQNPYQPYTDQRFAGFSPMQTEAFNRISNQQVAPQITDASNIAYTASDQALGAQKIAEQLQREAQRYGEMGAGYGASAAALAPEAQMYGGMGAGYGAQGVGIGGIGVQAAQQGFGAGQAYQQMATDPRSMQAYMSPYMQNVVEQQQKDARRQAEIERQGIQAQAVRQGAFGGSRSAIVEAERQKNLEDRLAMIQATGSQSAFDKAQQAQQFGSTLGLQGLQAGYQGLQTGLAGTAQGIQGAQAGLQGLQGAGQLYGLGITGAQAGLQGVGQATGAGQYGLQGAQTAIQGAGQLGQLGQYQYGQEMGITDAMQKFGALQQQQQQQQLDFQYQQFLARQQYPYQQLSYMSDLVRGTPSAQSAIYQYQQQPSLAPQLLGAGLSAYGAYARGSKEGGQIKAYADGGQVTPDAMGVMDVRSLTPKLRRLSDSQLAAYARSVKDAITLSAVQGELNRRTRARAPMGQPQDTTVADDIAKQAQAASLGGPINMAGGGIVALSNGGEPLTDEQKEALRMAGIPEGLATADRSVGNFFRNLWRGATANPAAVGEELAKSQQMPPRIDPNVVSPHDASQMDMVVNAPAPAAPPAPPQDKSGIAGAGQQPPAAPPVAAPQARAGIMQASKAAAPMTYEEWQKQAAPKGVSAEDQAVLDDMKSRVDQRISRAGKTEDVAKYDAIMMAGLAMMSGTSLADGIAKAAQVGGATFMQGKDKAAKAMDAAEEADMAFQKYRLELSKGNKKEARESFSDFMSYSAKLAEIAGRERIAQIQAGARGGDGAPNFGKVQTMLNGNKDYTAALAETKAAQERMASLSAIPNSPQYKEAKAAAEAAQAKVNNIRNNFFSTQPPEIQAMAQQIYGGGGASTPPPAVPVPSSKADLVKGQRYTTARGEAVWDGSQFVK